MKRKVEHPEPSGRAAAGPRYWRSLDELAQTPGFRAAMGREFPEGASGMDGVDRRQFMKIMAASFALGGLGLGGCRRPEENVLPFGKSVEGAVPGLPVYYATAMPLRRWAVPLLAETHQGRPTKLEGNPSYAPHGGSTSLFAQASILDLYDPDRATAHTREGRTIDAAAVKALLAAKGKAFEATGGEGLAFLADESSSLSRARLTRILRAKFPKSIWAEYEPVADEPPAEAAQAVFGFKLKPIYRLAKARRIVSIDADFLQAEAGSLYYARDFARGRRVAAKDDPMSRLYMAESGLSITGTMADHRLRLASGHMLAFAAALAEKVTGDAAYARAAQGLEVPAGWISECAADLAANRGASLVVAGSHLPAEVHAVAYAINAALGNIGAALEFVLDRRPAASSIQELADAVRKDAVKTLVILGGNPVYNAPADLDWASLQKAVPEVIRMGYYVDETSGLAGTHIAAAHYLESWGDARTIDGTLVPVQPMILPLFGGLTQNEVLASVAGLPDTDPYKLLYDVVAAIAGGAGPRAEALCRKFLHDGVLEGTALRPFPVRFNRAGVDRILAGAGPLPPVSAAAIEVRFVADLTVDDGRFVNNGWLQECPDPITKISWDNAILISPRLAKELGIDSPAALVQVARKDLADFDRGRENAHLVELTIGGRKLRGPAHIQPGLANYTVVVPLGYGRSRTGRVGQGTGFNAYAARESGALHVAHGASIAVTGDKMFLADSQWHWSMEGRELVREGNLAEYRENPAFVKEIGLEAESPPAVLGPDAAAMTPGERATLIPRGNSLYVTPQFDGKHQWGMSIDLNTCIGCNACVVACQAENNVPIVGKEQILRGRIMHWIRLDRYYSDGRADAAAFGGEGNLEIPEEPQISMQPVACMQCELAPCETVCPVNATVHDEEGLNVMAYNRCIGTRYCANNCPYKVRRFNFFDWNMRSLDSLYMGPLGPEGMPELVQMVKNPEVTIRMRGVMEKCTYCVQRIERGKIEWKVKVAQEGRPGDVVVPDGTIRTACQQACPVEAIVFGNILDPGSAVSRAKARDQDYALLGYLNTRPRTTYLARLRNPNPRMPDYAELPLSRVEYLNKNRPTKA
ncbi:MAG TPA: TAT-variant-translocated molybdopterin oxidoreductase [Opitutaceae bacterium]|nr:TAT-variant-translocated molybdopterin oxidoreductase [Opitutaceae bacterium]